MKWLWRWGHPHSLTLGVLGGMAVLTGHPWIVALAFALAFAAGAATAFAIIGVWKVGKRIDRALPDRGCAQCQRPISGRNKYCGETCREIAAEARMRQRIHAERMADFGESPL